MKLEQYDAPRIGTLRELLYQRMKDQSVDTMFTYMDTNKMISVGKQEFYRDVKRVAGWIMAQGMKTKHIALIGENSYEWLVVYFAITCTGNVCVTLDKDTQKEEIQYIVEGSECEAVFCSEQYFDKTEGMENIQRIKLILNMKDLKEFGEEPGGDAFENIEVVHTELATIVYTSGTTGNSKGVMLTHGNLVHDAVISGKSVLYHGITMAVLPFHHTLGLNAPVFVSMMWGCPVFINKSIKYLVRDYMSVKPTQMVVVPMFLGLFAKKIQEAVAASGEMAVEMFRANLSILISGGAKADPIFIEMFRKWGITVLDGYGITECSPVVSVNRLNYYRDGSVGPLLPEVEARIHEPNEKGEGEIQLKGPMVMQGYYHNPQATEEAFMDGWFRTGDIGRIDEDGFLFICGRIKNLIILSNGENISPEELEGFFGGCGDIADLMVIEKEHRLSAVVVLNAETVKEKGLEEVKRQVRNKIIERNKLLPNFKHIQKIYFRNEDFVRTSTKKIRRNAEENYIFEE